MMTVYLALIEDDSEQSLFEEIYIAYRQPMFALAMSILKDSSDAEDAVHDTFLNIAAKQMPMIKKLDNGNDRRNYILKATKNTSLNMLKKSQRNAMPIDSMTDEELLRFSDMTDDSFTEVVCTKYEYAQVVQAIKRMDRIYSDVLYYHFVLELKVSDVAKSLGRSVNTVKKQIVKGKKLLLAQLNNSGGDENVND